MSKIWLKSYEQGISPEIDTTEYKSLAHLINSNSEKFSNKKAFSCFGKTLSFSEIHGLSERFAAYLQQDLKLKKGDKIALMMPNILQYPVALFGALKAGLVVVNVNPLYSARELAHQLKDSDCGTILVLENFAKTVEEVIPEVNLKHVIITRMGDLIGGPKGFLLNLVVKKIKKMVPEFSIPNHIDFLKIIKKSKESDFVSVFLDKDDLAFLQYTGGTTGVSKGAMLSHGNILSNVIQAKSWLQNSLNRGSQDEVIITPLPLYHIFSLTANCFIYSSIGGLNVLITNPRDIPSFVKEMKKWKFTAITGLNTLFNALINNEEFKSIDFSYLKITLGGGMAVQKGVAEKWKKITGSPVIEAYGLTETSPAVCVNPLNQTEFNGYVGLPLPSTLVSIRDEEFNELASGEVGEICVKGPQVMSGYYKNEEETKKVFNDGWFKTGDLGFISEEGFVKIVDRKKDLIIVSGFNVYPNEIEDVVMLHPKVLECAVVGVKDEIKGEIVKLFLVKKDSSLTVEEIVSHCKKSLTAYKIPKEVEFKDSLPKSNVGKILRKELRS